MQEPPYAILRKEASKGKTLKGNDRYEGFCIDILTEIANIVGFEFTIVPVPDGRYGVRNKNGEWDGIVRQLIDRVRTSNLFEHLVGFIFIVWVYFVIVTSSFRRCIITSLAL